VPLSSVGQGRYRVAGGPSRSDRASGQAPERPHRPPGPSSAPRPRPAAARGGGCECPARAKGRSERGRYRHRVPLRFRLRLRVKAPAGRWNRPRWSWCRRLSRSRSVWPV